MRVYVLVLFNNLNRRSYISSTSISRTEESGHFPLQQYHTIEFERITHHVRHPLLGNNGKKNKWLASKWYSFFCIAKFLKINQNSYTVLVHCIRISQLIWNLKMIFFCTLDIHRIFKRFAYRSKTRFFTSTFRM